MDKNKKRYVYLDKYIDFQVSLLKRVSIIHTHIAILYTVTGLVILGLTALLYKLFG
jgi:hypothetical protein